MKRLSATTLAVSCLAFAASAGATGFTDIGQDIKSQTETTIKVEGAFRVRSELLYNLDLDRGPTPSGQLFFPVPSSDPTAQTLAGADMRLRTDVAFYAPGAGVAVKVRLDAPDDLALGTAPHGVPSSSSSLEPITVLRIKRAYGEALTPIGLFSAGRMGQQWGLGMLANGGDCADCDSGDSADRIGFVTPVAGHLWAAAFDWSSSGPFKTRRDGIRVVDVDPADDVHTLSFAVLKYRDDLARLRRQHAKKTTVDYGVLASHRWQTKDVPATYLPVSHPVNIDAKQVMSRGYTATAIDAWLRLTLPRGRIEAEGALLLASIDQPSLIPGVLLRDPVKSRQIGIAIESELGLPEDTLAGGLDGGYASGDPAPGFGVNPGLTQGAPKAGDLDGAQASPPGDNRVDNFRFHPDYRVDRILFREIIGTVTDAVYIRPHIRATLVDLGPAKLEASLAGVVSFAVEATSAPGGKSPLGIELDPTLAYKSKDGFSAALEHAVLFPLAGLSNNELHLDAKPAQLLRLRVMYAF